MKGKLSNGFEYEVDDQLLDNMELIDAIADADEDATAVSALVKMVFGDQRKALYENLRNEDGRVSVTAIVNAVKEIFEAFGEQGKNS